MTTKKRSRKTARIHALRAGLSWSEVYLLMVATGALPKGGAREDRAKKAA